MTNRDETMSLRRQILHILTTGKFTTREVADRLGVQSRAEVKKVRDTLGELAREGKVAQKFTERPEGWVKVWLRAGANTAMMQAKLWEFMWLRSHKAQSWTTAEAAKPAECTGDYARRYAGFLKDRGFIEPVGQKGNAMLYRVWPGMEREPAPVWNRRAEKRRAGVPPAAEGPQAGTPAPPKPPDTAKIVQEMQDALHGLVAGIELLADIFRDLRAALPLFKEASHEPKDRG